jgi:hypothetical protein
MACLARGALVVHILNVENRSKERHEEIDEIIEEEMCCVVEEPCHAL